MLRPILLILALAAHHIPKLTIGMQQDLIDALHD